MEKKDILGIGGNENLFICKWFLMNVLGFFGLFIGNYG